MGRVTRVVTGMGLRSNPLVWFLLNALVPWDLYFAHELDRCKLAIAQHASAWMDTWFELEALSSLANFAYLNPDYTFPTLLDIGGTEPVSVFQAQALGHPLIPHDEKVCNDFFLSGLGEVTIITGSNMAGKSVFLKTVGVNLALAYAGGPVNAGSLQSMPFRLFTCLGISDSVTDGISYFYAEVKRLKALLEELERDHSLPLLFCIDEIFRGTNNRERLIGSRAYVRALAGKNGVGFIATHDLELAKLADEVAQVQNYHFRDSVVADRMAFDYLLRPGPCPTTNALSIMQLEGLPIPSSPDGGLQTKTKH
jgi:DNA mismatch repair ATPase MutS